jgi:hypothetical protein
MTVYISEFANGDGTWTFIDDGLNHTGSIQSADVTYTINMDGSYNHNLILVTCPICGSATTHPVGGGAQPLSVQKMFVLKTEIDGCPCGQTQPDDTSGLPESHVRLNCNRMDGPGRWQLDQSPQNFERLIINPQENSPNMFQVVYRKSDGLIVGLEPSGGVGPDNSVQPIHDMTEYDVLMRTDPAYLSEDGDHIVSEPRP